MRNNQGIIYIGAVATLALYGCDTAARNDADTGTAASASQNGQDRGADSDAIKQLDAQWLKWAMAKNVDSMLTIYSPDAYSFMQGEKPITDADGRRKAYTDFVGMNLRDASLNNLGVQFSDDGTMATSYGTYAGTLTMAGRDIKDEGSYLSVWKRTPSGWRTIAEMSNSSMPMGAPPPATRR